MQKIVVYVDVLVTLNFVINYLLLGIARRIAGREKRTLRQILAALLGAAASLVILLPGFGPWLLMGVKLLLSAAMVLLCFRFATWRQLFRDWLLFFIVSFLFGGVMSAIQALCSPSRMVVHNGAVYLHISPLWLIGVAAVSYLLLGLFNRTLRAQVLPAGRYTVLLQLGEKQVRLRGILDTGNALRDRFTDTPVLVCGLVPLKPLFSPAADGLPEGLSGAALFEALFPLGLRELRLLPCQTVSSSGMLVAFRPDRAVVEGREGACELQNILVGIGDMGRHRQVDALLSPAMVRVEQNRKAGNQV